MHTTTLQTALAYHQRGELAQAVQLYREILAVEPNHVDALHLLGVAATQSGDPRRAIELIGRAIALNANVAAFHANLAEAYRVDGQLDQAGNHCAKALELRPDYPEARNNLGLVRMGQGKLDEALAHFQIALQLRPDYSMALNNLANILRQKGEFAQAIGCLRRAVELEPRAPMFRSNLGQMLLDHKHLGEALEQCQVAARLQPRSAQCQNNLGNVLRELDRLYEAKVCYVEAVRLDPRLATAYDNLGLCLQEEAQLADAVRCFQQAIQLEPNNARFHTNLGNAFREGQDLANAVASYRKALQLDGNQAEAHHGLGLIAQEQERTVEAEKHYRDAVRVKPQFGNGYCALGQLMAERNDLPAAAAILREGLRHDPTHANVLGQLASLLGAKLSDNELESMRTLAAAPLLSDVKRIPLLYGLGQIYDACDNFDEAARYFRDANVREFNWCKERGRGYDVAAHACFVDQLLAAFTPELFERMSGWGSESERPVFIFGLPRSGTTLVEQILASHSRIHGAGELRLARDDFEALVPGGNEPQCFAALGRLERAGLQQLANAHLDKLHKLHPTADRVSDKMPDNYMYVGLMYLFFPQAKFIHCRRDLRDIAVSCWTTQFAQIRWANTFEQIASRFRQYRRIIDHWERVLPASVLQIDYEDTVEDLEGVARRLIEWCDLEWQPACLQFHKTRRPVRTASITQVRQPIYKRSVARWKNYESMLDPLFRQLEELASLDLLETRG
jgi:tetratricopeptide (TPR) repeat protein